MMLDEWALRADIGGTNARFQMARIDGGQPQEIVKRRCADFASIEDAILDVLGDGTRPSHACLAVAGPVTGDQVKLTNRAWSFSIETVRQAVGLRRLFVINDFEAQALACPDLPAADWQEIGGPFEPVDGKPILAIGPGTGLGVCGALPIELAGKVIWRAVPSEGGHIELASTDPRARAAIELARKDRDRVGAEYFICGGGLARLHLALGEVDGVSRAKLHAPSIVAAALKADRDCRDTVTVFIDLFAGLTGDMALTFGARGGVYLCGGIFPRIRDLVDDKVFRATFANKGRLSFFNKDISLRLVTADTPALIGCAAYMRHVAIKEQAVGT